MKKVTEHGFTNEVVQTRSSKLRVLVPLAVAVMLFVPSQVSADWTFADFKIVAKKVVKKVVLPATVIIGSVADAAEAYSDGKSTSEIVGTGLGGAVTRIGNSLEETASDIVTISNVAIDTYNKSN